MSFSIECRASPFGLSCVIVDRRKVLISLTFKMNVLDLLPSLACSHQNTCKQSTHLGHIHEDALRECDAKPQEVRGGATLLDNSG